MSESDLIPIEVIANKIYTIRKQKVMLDKDLAELYQVGTKVLNQAVKRNIERFPKDFMFQLEGKELNAVVSQFVTPSKQSFGGHLPYAFTELGVAMLSSVLKSKKAIEINILIMRVFNRIRNLLASNEELRQKVAQLDYKLQKTNDDVQALMSAVDMLLDPPEQPRKQFGFVGPNVN